jgi:Na+-transporting methylmalonyl-CoA/oxaloacetate decarboxylase gamma subunit
LSYKRVYHFLSFGIFLIYFSSCASSIDKTSTKEEKHETTEEESATETYDKDSKKIKSAIAGGSSLKAIQSTPGLKYSL